MRYVLDSGVIIKGLIKPRRRKKDQKLEEQVRIYNLASSLMRKVYKKEINLIIPVAAIIEIAAVTARLTGKKEIGVEIANFVNSISNQVISEMGILGECIDMAAFTKISGFDSVFIACADITDSTLITDDRKMYDAAIKVGVEAKLLREMESGEES